MNNNPFLSKFLTEKDLSSCPFRSLGTNVMIHERANLVGLENMAIGSNVRIDPFVSLIATASLTIGSYVHIGAYSYISAGETVILDDFSGLSQGVKIYTHSDDYSGKSLTNPTVPAEYKKITKGSVRLGRHAIIGAGAVILPGAVLGDGVAVGALSLVTKSLQPWGIYTGRPAKRIRSRSDALLSMERRLLAGSE